MRHGVHGRKLSRTKNERRRLFMLLARDLITHGSVRTTIAKAKAVQPMVEKLVTRAKSGTEVDRRRVESVLADKNITTQLFTDAKDRFSQRTSGFTRIVKLGKRLGDATEEVFLSFVDQKQVPVLTETVKSAPKAKKLVAKVEKKPATKKPAVKKSASKKK